MNLTTIGWNEHFTKHFAAYEMKGYTVGRVALEHKRTYRVWTETNSLLAEVSGKFRFEATSREDFPAVGDWVVISARPDEEKATIHAVLPRKSKFSRKEAGNKTEEQIVGTNIDTVFLVNALNDDFNVRRIERYLLMAWESGANPVIILSKADLCSDVSSKIREVESVAFGVPILPISAFQETGMEELAPYLREGQTVALLGSSGVGKSTLTNYLYGMEKQEVRSVRENDDKGKHTTTFRELFLLPSGGVLLDTPGMRELQLWGAESGMEQSFADVEQLAASCRFSDCQHKTEKDCAIKDALESGQLGAERFKSYLKLQRELAHLEQKAKKLAALEEKRKGKKADRRR